MRLIAYGTAALIAAGAFSFSAHAQKPAQQEPITVVGEHPDKKAPDPNEVICEKQQEIGSRIVSKRVCMTRSQWDEQRRLDRQDLDRAQNQRPMR